MQTRSEKGFLKGDYRPAEVSVEIAAHTIASASAAQAGGAKRVELFSNWLEGGTTPSEGLISTVRELLLIPLHVMIRPRGGNFHYSAEELLAMKRDVAAAKRLGANGVVLGFVNLDGRIDVERTRELTELARPLEVTFHRAFDTCRDLSASLENLIGCGVDRVLTSGGGACALDSLGVLSHLTALAGDQIAMIACGAVTAENAREIIHKTGVREIHAGLRSAVQPSQRFANEQFSLGEDVVVKEEDVRRLVSEVQGL